ncbi:putative inner membrane protein [Chlamydia ibidis]|uniref:Inner membrane protein n=2 Tax=Chlamydia ibidis TaxID=1405396 RepID=A0ABN0N013_9CHLA|nr:hypothetical protein [Chlamydia ibidis]EPP34685.1 putative inner membrane protein [Chlamydia ibidis]EQM62936.1 putative inner membrane protein [Chlamydia ibidis 10-1398/6]
MDFKLPIYHIGLSHDAYNATKIAILQKTCKGWIVAECKQCSDNGPLSISKKYFTSKGTLSIRGQNSLVKSFFSSLKKKKNLLQVALSDLETHTALPLDSLSIFSRLGQKTTQGETPITLWITQKSSIEEKLGIVNHLGLFPGIISCHLADIFFLVEQTPLKTLPAYFLIYQGSEEISCLFVQNRSVILGRSFSNVCENVHEQIASTFRYFQETYTSVDLAGIHIVGISESLFNKLAQILPLSLISCTVPTFGVDADVWKTYGDAIISAYHGASNKAAIFPYDPYQISNIAQTYWFKRSAWTIGRLALLSAVAVGFVSFSKLSLLSSKVRENLCLACPEISQIPWSLDGVEDLVKRQTLCCESPYLYLPTILTSQEVMIMLGNLSQSTPSVKFSYFSYLLTSFPSEEDPLAPYKANIVLKGSGDPEDMTMFFKKISLSPHFNNTEVTHLDADQRTFELQFNLIGQGDL